MYTDRVLVFVFSLLSVVPVLVSVVVAPLSPSALFTPLPSPLSHVSLPLSLLVTFLIQFFADGLHVFLLMERPTIGAQWRAPETWRCARQTARHCHLSGMCSC